MYAATHAFTTTVQHFKFLSFILITNLSTFTIECLSIFLSLARSFSSSLALFSVFTFTLLHTHLQRQYLVKLNLHLCVPLANSQELLYLLLLVCVCVCKEEQLPTQVLGAVQDVVNHFAGPTSSNTACHTKLRFSFFVAIFSSSSYHCSL